MDINIINFSDFDYSKIKLSNPINITSTRKKIFIGYENEDNIHILSPYLNNNLIYTTPIKHNFIKLIFDPFIGPIYDFYKLIENFETNIKTHINQIMPHYNFISIIKSDQTDIFDDDKDDNENNNINDNLNISYIHLKLNLNETRDGKITKIYDSNSIECEINKLKNGWKYKCLIHFNYIWFDSEKKRCGLSLDISQIKIYQPSYLSKCLIDNSQSSHSLQNQIYTNIIPYNISQTNNSNKQYNNTDQIESLQNNTNQYKQIQNNVQTINNIKPIMIMPNAMELLNIKNALKKVL